MKIAMIGQKGIPCTIGGVERYVEEISTRLAKMGHKVTVYTRPYYTDKNKKVFKRVRLVSLPTVATKHLDAILHSLLATLHALFIQKTDVIHFVNIGPGFWAWLPRLLKPRTFVLGKFESMDWNHKKWGWFAQWSLKLGAWSLCLFSHQTIAVSKEIQIYVKEKYGLDLPVLANGYTIRRPLKKSEIKQELNSMELVAEKFFFTASRLVKHKGIHHLIEAFKHVKDNGIPRIYKNMSLVIAGEGFHTDDYVRYLKSLAGTRNDIKFVGFQTGKKLQALFEGAKAFIQPSEAEGMSMVLIEALGYARLVVASDISPNLEAVGTPDSQKRAVLFKSASAADLANKLKQVLRQDLKAVGSRARSRMKQTYSWDTVAQRIESLLESK